MQIQKIFSDYCDNERLYSVLMNEYELALFSEAVEEAEKEESCDSGLRDSLIGAGIGAGAAGAAYGLGKGSGWLNKKLANRRSKKMEKISKQLEKLTAADAEKVKKLQVKKLDLKNTGRLEKLAGKYGETTNKTQEWIKKNPGKASAIAAGVLALGAGAGYGVSKLKGKKRDEE